MLGVTWFPYVVLSAVCCGLAYLAAPELIRELAHGKFDQNLLMANLPHLLGIFSLVWILVFITSCMIRVGLLRLALGEHPGPVFFFFSLGAEVWMMVGAFFLAALIIVLVAILTVAAVIAVWFGAGTISVPAAVNAIRAVAIIAGALWFVYFYVRLIFFLPAVVVAEKEIGLGRAWTLGGGNFWRIVVVAIAVFFPVAIGYSMVQAAITGPFFYHMDFLKDPHQFTPQDFTKLIAQQLSSVGPVYLLLLFIRTILFEGLGAGLVGSAYRGVVPPPATE